MRASTLLRRLEQASHRFDPETAEVKRDLLARLGRRRLTRATDVVRLHDTTCFIRAYPDDQDVLAAAERLLASFARRGDLRTHLDVLADTGIAGTTTYFRFFFKTALWLARRMPDQLRIDWEDFENDSEIVDLLNLFVPYAETLAVDNAMLDAKEWLEVLEGPGETDAAFLMRRFDAMDMDVHGKEATFEGIDVPFVLDPGPHTPNRTDPRYAPAPVVFQTRPLTRKRPDLFEAVQQRPKSVRAVSSREGQKLIDLTREAMIARSRDLYAFLHADKRDVRIVDCGEGLQFACIGMIPERRLVVESVYGFLTLKNGVPIGYVLSSSGLCSSEIAFNVFESFRGAEAGVVFGHVLAMVKYLFEPDTFSIDPYQLGYNNPEGLESGAWWFYYKMGFRPYDPVVKKLLRRELARMRRNPKHRSSITTLNKLASRHMYLYLGKERADVLGRFPLDRLGLAVSSYMAKRFGAERERGIQRCSAEAAKRLGVRSLSRFSRSEKLLWERWSPLVMALPGIARWKPEQRRALAQLIRAKGGRRESEYVKRFNRHPRLRAAFVKLAESYSAK